MYHFFDDLADALHERLYFITKIIIQRASNIIHHLARLSGGTQHMTPNWYPLCNLGFKPPCCTFQQDQLHNSELLWGRSIKLNCTDWKLRWQRLFTSLVGAFIYTRFTENLTTIVERRITERNQETRGLERSNDIFISCIYREIFTWITVSRSIYSSCTVMKHPFFSGDNLKITKLRSVYWIGGFQLHGAFFFFAFNIFVKNILTWYRVSSPGLGPSAGGTKSPSTSAIHGWSGMMKYSARRKS